MKLNREIVAKLLACLLFGSLVSAAASASVPRFVNQSIYASHSAKVDEVVPSLAADVVILDAGLAQGVRLGMVCRVTRGATDIAEVIVIRSKRDRSAALILELKPDRLIRPGDQARVKTTQNS